jgi:CRP-like cAMP-binding protein
MESFLNHWTSLLHQACPLHLEAGQHLFYQGHKPTGVYVILQGRVLLFETSDRSSARVLENHRPFGIDLLLYDRVFPCEAIVTEAIEGFFIPKSQVLSLAEVRPSVM